MVVDTSALVTTLQNEPERVALTLVLRDDPVRRMSTAAHAAAAREAFRRLGKGCHPAALN